MDSIDLVPTSQPRSATATPFNKTRLKKPDGRAMLLYSRSEIDPSIKATNPTHDPISNQPHLRWHPLRGEWVAYASHRQNRTFLPPKEYNPLAPSNSTEFPTELPVGNYEIAVFENLFASLVPEVNEANTVPDAYVPTEAGRGACEVVVFTQDPSSALSRLPLDRVELLLNVWADRTTEIGARDEIHYVLPFENRGVEVGVTLHHPHGQIYAYPFVPPLEARLHEMQKQYRKDKGTGLVEDMIRSERADQVRVLFDDGLTTAFVPICARYPYEVWIAPNRQVGFLSQLSAQETRSFATALKTVLMKFDGLWSRPFPYLMALYQAPTKGDATDFHFHVEFYPPYRSKDRLKYLAGTELAAGMFVNDSLPEEKAAELKAVEVDVHGS